MERKVPHELGYYKLLAEKLVGGTISGSEKEELESWYRQNTGTVHVPQSFAAGETALKQRLLDKIKEKIAEGRSNEGNVKRKNAKSLWIKIGWAAVIGGLIFAPVYFVSNRIDFRDAAAGKAVTETLKPGGNKAILTLADGSVVALDAANNGVISEQGNISVMKLADGQIAYRKGDRVGQSLVYNTVSTPRGGQYQLTLEDGTKVWLNAQSSLRFPTAFAQKQRVVELTGEGYFEVAHDSNRAFYVKAGGTIVKVTGTHFEVNAYADDTDVKTTLAEGRVQVSVGTTSVRLTPGQQAQSRAADNHIQVVKNVDMEQVLAWKNGYFQFTDASLQTILSEAARWYDADIVYEGEVDGNFTGNLPRSEHIASLLKVLAATDKVEFEVVGKQIIVKPK